MSELVRGLPQASRPNWTPKPQSVGALVGTLRSMALLETDQRQRSRYIEDMTARAVVAHLMSEGRTVSSFSRPSTGPARSPDFVATVDHDTVAIEVVRFIDPQIAKAVARVRSVEHALKPRLQAEASRLGRAIVLDLSFCVAPLQHYRRPDVERDADLLAIDVRSALARLPQEGGSWIELETTVPWVHAAVLAGWAASEPSFYVGSLSPEPSHPIPDAPSFVAHLLATKLDQHIGHAERAILAIRGTIDDVEDIRFALAARPVKPPWWRAYLVWAGGNGRVVWEQDG